MKNRLGRLAARSLAARQQGVTLIELSITLVIALFLLGGLFTILQNTRKTYIEQNQLTSLQDSQRAAMTIITNVVESAGYFPDPTTYTTADFVAAGTMVLGQTITGTHASAAPGDTLTVRFETGPSDGILSCINNTNTTASNTVMYTNTLAVIGGFLTCTDQLGGAPVQLVPNVNNMQLWYGIKTNFGTSDFNVDTYVQADQMQPADWNNISAIRVQLTFANPLTGQPGQPATITFERVVAVMNRAGVYL